MLVSRRTHYSRIPFIHNSPTGHRHTHTHSRSPEWCIHTYLWACFVAVAAAAAAEAMVAIGAAIGIIIRILFVAFAFLYKILVFSAARWQNLEFAFYAVRQSLWGFFFFARTKFERNQFASTFFSSIDWTMNIETSRRFKRICRKIPFDRIAYFWKILFWTRWPSIRFYNTCFDKCSNTRIESTLHLQFVGRSSSIHCNHAIAKLKSNIELLLRHRWFPMAESIGCIWHTAHRCIDRNCNFVHIFP